MGSIHGSIKSHFLFLFPPFFVFLLTRRFLVTLLDIGTPWHKRQEPKPPLLSQPNFSLKRAWWHWFFFSLNKTWYRFLGSLRTWQDTYRGNRLCNGLDNKTSCTRLTFFRFLKWGDELNGEGTQFTIRLTLRTWRRSQWEQRRDQDGEDQLGNP